MSVKENVLRFSNWRHCTHGRLLNFCTCHPPRASWVLLPGAATTTPPRPGPSSGLALAVGSWDVEAQLEGFWALPCWHVKWAQLCSSVNILWHCPFWGLESCGHCWVFQICWHIEGSTLAVSSFRIWNSSAGIPSPPFTLFAVMLPKAHLTSYSRMFGSRWVITPSCLSGSLRTKEPLDESERGEWKSWLKS